ncbi:hypothetical protein ACF0H5_015556 [Mactra antiquata]
MTLYSSSESVDPKPEMTQKDTHLPPIVKNVRKIRDNSDDEDYTPFAELQQHLRNKPQYNKNGKSKQVVYESDDSQNSSQPHSDSIVSSEDEMTVDSIIRNKHMNKVRKNNKKSVKSALTKCMSILIDNI